MEEKKRSFKVGIVIVVIVAVFVLLSPFVIIQPGFVGVVVNLGAVQTGVLDEGLHFKIPVYQKVKQLDTRVKKSETQTNSASKDLQQVNANIAVNYKIMKDTAAKLYQSVGETYVSTVISPAIQESMKSTTAKYTAEELITRRQDVSNECKTVLNSKVKPYGIEIVEFNMVDFNFSQEFNNAIEAKQTAQQLALKAKQDLERIKIEAEQKVANAEAEARSLKAQKEQISAELIELRKVEAQIKAIEKWDGKLPQYAGGQGMLFNLPVQAK